MPEVPGYEVLAELGRGGMGVVYQAVQKATKRTVALKVLLHGGYTSPRNRMRFEREVDLVASMQHPNIVTIFDSGVTSASLPYFAMEYIDGASLDQHIRSGGSPELADVLRLFARICEAVHYAHQHGVIHRDLKPGNIRVDPQGEPHILDFGLAKPIGGEGAAAGQTLTGTGEFLGTPAYASPEQVSGDPKQIDTRTDVYSLGVVLYEMLTGHYPHEVRGPITDVLLAIVDAEPIPPSFWQRRSASSGSNEPGRRFIIDPELEAIVLKALAKSPSERYQSAGMLAEEVMHYLAGEPIQARPPSMTFLVRKWVRQNFQATLGIVAIGLVCGLLAPPLAILKTHRPLWQDCASAYALFPDLERPWVIDLALGIPDWLLPADFLIRCIGLGAMGLFAAWLVRPRHRDEDVIVGIATGLVAGIAAFSLGGMGWGMALGMGLGAARADLDLLCEGCGSPDPPDVLVNQYPQLMDLPPAERAEAVRNRILAINAGGLYPTLSVGLLYALALCGGYGVAGTLAAGYLVRRHGRFLPTIVPYLEMAIPGVPLIRAVLVWRAGLIGGQTTLLLGTLTAAAVLGMVRRWPPQLRLALYAAGLTAWMRISDWELPFFLDLIAVLAATGAVAWQALGLPALLCPNHLESGCQGSVLNPAHRSPHERG